MSLLAEILKEHSKQKTMKIVRWVGTDQRRFSSLVQLFLSGTPLVRQRAGWPLSYCAMAHPDLVRPFLKKLLENLRRKDLHDAEKRNTVRFLQDLDLPEKLEGLAAEVLFPLVSTPAEPVAVKCFSMTALARVCKKHPDLARELKMILEEQLPYSTAGFRSRAKRTFKELNIG